MCETKQRLVGFAKVDITPDYPVRLAGYSDDEFRISQMVVEHIYTTCIAVTEGDETILIYTNDNLSCNHGMAENIRLGVTAATGIAGEKIFIAATHCHSCPGYGGEPNTRFRNQWIAGCVEAAKQALADQAPAKMLAGTKEFPGMNFVRHFMTANGTPAGSNFGTFKDNPAVGYLSEPDSQMVLIKFEREGLKKPILMVNWQGHPDRGSEIGRLNLAPSYPAPLRDTLSALTGCLVAYFTGADGNTNIDSRIPEHQHNLNWREYGVKMANLGYEAYKELQEVEGSGISYKRVIFEAPIDHSWDDKIEQAREVYDLWKATDAKTAMEIGRTYGFTSVYQSRAIKSRYEMPKTRTLELNAFRVGGIGFTTGTYEMFSEAGIYIKENSPYEFTFLLTGNSGYIPSDKAFNYRCYEADTGFFARGTAELLAEKYVEMLKDIQ
jgi:hypothetical protein